MQNNKITMNRATILEDMSQADIEIFALYFYDCYSQEQIAKMLDMTKRKVQLAIDRIKSAIAEQGLPAPKRVNYEKQKRQIIQMGSDVMDKCIDTKKRYYPHNEESE